MEQPGGGRAHRSALCRHWGPFLSSQAHRYAAPHVQLPSPSSQPLIDREIDSPCAALPTEQSIQLPDAVSKSISK